MPNNNTTAHMTNFYTAKIDVLRSIHAQSEKENENQFAFGIQHWYLCLCLFGWNKFFVLHISGIYERVYAMHDAP